MPRRPSRRTLIFLVTLVLGIAIVWLVRASLWPAENALVGAAEAVVRARYGDPKHEFAGHYGVRPLVWTQQFKGEMKTCVFWRVGGEVYVTFEKRNGLWVVISNSYLPRGGVF